MGFVAARTPAAAAYWREAGISLGCGISAAVAAWCAAVWLLRLSARRPTLGAGLLTFACLPGLCGPLAPSLFFVELMQRQPVLSLRDTVVPMVSVLALFLLPRAVLLEALSRLTRDLSATHLARSLRSSPDRGQRSAGRRLLWELGGFGRVCRVSLLTYWAYLDLTAGAILAPPDVVPVTARLYNLMHYGHNAALSGMALVTVAVPVAAFVALLAARSLSLRLFAR